MSKDGIIQITRTQDTAIIEKLPAHYCTINRRRRRQK
jgi:hypothetical protein